MSEERDTPAAGAPVEDDEATHTQVQAAVERASVAGGTAPAASDETLERPVIAPVSDPPSAGQGPSAAEIFAATATASAASTATARADGAGAAAPAVTPTEPAPTTGAGAAELRERLEADAAEPPSELGPPRDGEIRISADHPMAALYMQTPMPPELKGNRGAGVLIALVATLGFALVYAGVLALWIAPLFPPSTFLTEGLVPLLLSWGFIAAVAGFFVALVILVLIAGRAGWWAYVLGGLLVAVLVWAATLGGVALDARFAGDLSGFNPARIVEEFGLSVPVIAAALVAREATVWFGAWIGARGRKVTRRNAEAVAEYESALAEVQANPR